MRFLIIGPRVKLGDPEQAKRLEARRRQLLESGYCPKKPSNAAPWPTTDRVSTAT